MSTGTNHRRRGRGRGRDGQDGWRGKGRRVGHSQPKPHNSGFGRSRSGHLEVIDEVGLEMTAKATVMARNPRMYGSLLEVELAAELARLRAGRTVRRRR
jgi:hypothetical protein